MAKIKCNKQNFICFSDLPLGEPFVRFEDIRQHKTDRIYVKVSTSKAVVVSGKYSESYSVPENTFVFPCRVVEVEIS